MENICSILQPSSKRAMELKLQVMLSAMDCYLREKGQEYSILKDKMFDSCRKVFNGKAIELRERHGKMQSNTLTSDEEQLWRLKVLGSNNQVP